MKKFAFYVLISHYTLDTATVTQHVHAVWAVWNRIPRSRVYLLSTKPHSGCPHVLQSLNGIPCTSCALQTVHPAQRNPYTHKICKNTHFERRDSQHFQTVVNDTGTLTCLTRYVFRRFHRIERLFSLFRETPVRSECIARTKDTRKMSRQRGQHYVWPAKYCACGHCNASPVQLLPLTSVCKKLSKLKTESSCQKLIKTSLVPVRYIWTHLPGETHLPVSPSLSWFGTRTIYSIWTEYEKFISILCENWGKPYCFWSTNERNLMEMHTGMFGFHILYWDLFEITMHFAAYVIN